MMIADEQRKMTLSTRVNASYFLKFCCWGTNVYRVGKLPNDRVPTLPRVPTS